MHIYQGLDVVIFSVLKHQWMEAQLAFKARTQQKINKTTFLSVYAEAHSKALSKENILTAFWKTGIVPLNRDAIMEEMLAPSIPSSSRGVLLIPQDSPIRVMSDMIQCDLARRMVHFNDPMELDEDEGLMMPLTPSRKRHLPHISTPVRIAVDELASTSAAYLVTTTPPCSSAKVPRYRPYTISPRKPQSFVKLDLQWDSLTVRESELLGQLRRVEDRCDTYKSVMFGMQAQTILHRMFVSMVQGHLQEHEESTNRKKKKNWRFGLGDGHAKLLTGDAFYSEAVKAEEEARRREAEKEERKKRNEAHGAALSTWKKLDDARQARNNQICQVYHDAVEAWEAEREAAKAIRQKPKPLSTKPKRGPLEPRMAKPKKVMEDEDEDLDEDEDGEASW